MTALNTHQGAPGAGDPVTGSLAILSLVGTDHCKRQDPGRPSFSESSDLLFQPLQFGPCQSHSDLSPLAHSFCFQQIKFKKLTARHIPMTGATVMRYSYYSPHLSGVFIWCLICAHMCVCVCVCYRQGWQWGTDTVIPPTKYSARMWEEAQISSWRLWAITSLLAATDGCINSLQCSCKVSWSIRPLWIIKQKIKEYSRLCAISGWKSLKFDFWSHWWPKNFPWPQLKLRYYYFLCKLVYFSCCITEMTFCIPRRGNKDILKMFETAWAIKPFPTSF